MTTAEDVKRLGLGTTLIDWKALAVQAAEAESPLERRIAVSMMLEAVLAAHRALKDLAYAKARLEEANRFIALAEGALFRAD